MEKVDLKNLDPLDIDDAIFSIEKSFNLKFKDDELSEIKTFGELVDIVSDKIKLENIESCTTQQAFYKIRKALKEAFNIDNVTPKTKLAEIFPKKNRRKNVKNFEKSLGFKINILTVNGIATITLLITFLFSIFYLGFDWKIGILGILISILGFKITFRFAKELVVKTIGELSEKITRENYLNSRSNSKSFNKKEIESIIMELFCEHTAIERHELTRASSFV